MKFIIELSANETQKAIEQGIILDLITKASEKVSTAPAAPAAPATPQQVQSTPAPAASVAPTAPVTPVAPVAPPTSAMPQSAPVAPTTPVAPTAPAPTTSATFTVEQLATAAMQLKDQARIGELQNLLAQFGVASLVQLSPEQLPVFAQSLQALGVKL